MPRNPTIVGLSGISASSWPRIGDSDATAVRRLNATTTMPTSARVRPAHSGLGAVGFIPASLGSPPLSGATPSSVGEDEPDAVDVVADRVDEVGDAREGDHAANALDELDVDDMVVEVELAIEHVRLDLLLRHALERGIVADRDRGRISGACIGEPAGVHTVGGDQALGLGCEVRRGESELAAAGGTVDDDARHRRRVAEEPGRLAHVTLGEQLPDPGGGDAPLPRRTHVVDDL